MSILEFKKAQFLVVDRRSQGWEAWHREQLAVMYCLGGEPEEKKIILGRKGK